MEPTSVMAKARQCSMSSWLAASARFDRSA
jgi:hypothetical protein